jgi:hypothetical protein
MCRHMLLNMPNHEQCYHAPLKQIFFKNLMIAHKCAFEGTTSIKVLTLKNHNLVNTPKKIA